MRWTKCHGYTTKKQLTLGGRGIQTDTLQYDTRGYIAINYYHRNGNNRLDIKTALNGLHDVFRKYGKRLILISQYNTVFNTQIYFYYHEQPPEEKIGQWMNEIKSVMNECS